MMTHDTDPLVELAFEQLRNRQRPYAEPGIKMRIAEWYLDELWILTREITARE